MLYEMSYAQSLGENDSFELSASAQVKRWDIRYNKFLSHDYYRLMQNIAYRTFDFFERQKWNFLKIVGAVHSVQNGIGSMENQRLNSFNYALCNVTAVSYWEMHNTAVEVLYLNNFQH